ncbi:unnamed protein product [Brugia timori]|uniref:Uncharacterized protein n=1 Tax=Brugia timori TaxID=42155 RepID=A0A3P7WI15_9BILA|nr:unnamed protein product [Brugia timori]
MYKEVTLTKSEGKNLFRPVFYNTLCTILTHKFHSKNEHLG